MEHPRFQVSPAFRHRHLSSSSCWLLKSHPRGSIYADCLKMKPFGRRPRFMPLLEDDAASRQILFQDCYGGRPPAKKICSGSVRQLFVSKLKKADFRFAAALCPVEAGVDRHGLERLPRKIFFIANRSCAERCSLKRNLRSIAAGANDFREEAKRY